MAENMKIRRPTKDDMVELYSLISQSTGGKTSLTTESLWKDLNNRGDLSHVEQPEQVDGLQFDSKSCTTNVPIVEVLLAETQQLVGYLMFSNFFTPWIGNVLFVNDIYTVQDFRKTGVARKLLDEAKSIAKKRGIDHMIFETSRADKLLLNKLSESGCRTFRNEETDWDVYMMDLMPH